MKTIEAFEIVEHELGQAVSKFPAMNSFHEGKAVIEEELEELWEEIKGEQRPERLRAEATQVAAMAIRFLVDLCEGEK